MFCVLTVQVATGEAQRALRQKGKFRKINDKLAIKEVILDPESTMRRRFVVVRNSAEARRDAAKRADIIGLKSGYDPMYCSAGWRCL